MSATRIPDPTSIILPANAAYATYSFLALRGKERVYQHLLDTAKNLGGHIRTVDGLHGGGTTALREVDLWLQENNLTLPQKGEGLPGKAEEWQLIILRVPIDQAKTIEYLVDHDAVLKLHLKKEEEPA